MAAQRSAAVGQRTAAVGLKTAVVGLKTAVVGLKTAVMGLKTAGMVPLRELFPVLQREEHRQCCPELIANAAVAGLLVGRRCFRE